MKNLFFLFIICFYTITNSMDTSLEPPSLFIQKLESPESIVNILVREGESRQEEDLSSLLREAVDQLRDKEVARLLANGALISQRDARGRTLFQRICERGSPRNCPENTLNALLTSPRKSVIDTVTKMGVAQGNLVTNLTRWHIWGLLRVLMMTAKDVGWDGDVTLDFDSLFEQFGLDIIKGYNNYVEQKATEELYDS